MAYQKGRNNTFINSSSRDEWVTLPKKRDILKKLHNDDKDVYKTSMNDRYAARPVNLKHKSLIKFAVSYEVFTSTTA